jgi:trans-aconitate methyltransferase
MVVSLTVSFIALLANGALNRIQLQAHNQHKRYNAHLLAATATVDNAAATTDYDAAVIPVPDDFLNSHNHNLANIDVYKQMYKQSVEDPDAFWGKIANEFHWEQPFDQVVDYNFDSTKGKVFTSWF